MEDKIIDFETAKMLKEMGYKMGSFTTYHEDGSRNTQYNNGKRVNGHPNMTNGFEAPTQSFLCKWLREKHNIHVYVISYDKYTKKGWFYNVEEIGGGDLIPCGDADTHDVALEEGIKAALTYIKTKHHEQANKDNN